MRHIIPALFILFVVEIIVIIEVGSRIGALYTVTALFAFMIIGVALVKARFRAALAEMQDNPRPSLHILWIPLAGFFMLIPGFVSDAIGVLLLIPQVQHFLERKITDGLNSGKSFWFYGQGSAQDPRGGRIIDAEYTEVREERKEAGAGSDPKDSGKS
ncbi:MAG: FxsA family protein [Succinivibrio sp.]